jgi:hypothetical protein
VVISIIGAEENRMNRNPYLLVIFGIILILTTACSTLIVRTPQAQTYTFDLKPADFVEGVDNPYFPLVPGTKWIYEGQSKDGLERIEVEVQTETREVMGITATIVRDTVHVDGKIVEDTFDWFAQDKEGNVWYLGEDVSNYENGELADKTGSWEAGVDGALPGIIMYSDPTAHIGETYRQEYYPGQAEDMAELLSVTESVSVPFGSFEDVLMTKDYTPLEPNLMENKFYAQGIGLIKEIDPNTGEEVLLMAFTNLRLSVSKSLELSVSK